MLTDEEWEYIRPHAEAFEKADDTRRTFDTSHIPSDIKERTGQHLDSATANHHAVVTRNAYNNAVAEVALARMHRLPEPMVLVELDPYGFPKMIDMMAHMCHGLARRAGWWTNNATGEPLTLTGELFATKIALCHSELSEALEGYRKDLMDDHLPEHKMAVVELADVLIRVFDLAGACEFTQLGSVMMEKLRYNQERADHKLENRTQAHGKAF